MERRRRVLENMDEIYRQNADVVYRYLFSLCKDADLSEEMTQQTFFEAIGAIGRYRGDASVTTFLCGIAKNQLMRELRRRNMRAALPLDEVSAAAPGGTESSVINGLDKQELFRRISRLKPQIKEVVYLRLAGELSFAEIGEILERSETWARVTFYRAKQELIKGDD